MLRTTKHLFRLGLIALACSAAVAQPTGTVLTDAAQKALQSNPDVLARYNAFRASRDEIDVASGGFLPRLDLSADVGRTQDSFDSRNPERQSLNRSGVALTLSQLLWDGQATRREVDRLGHAKLARYFELLDVSEQTALEAARAHQDVQRYRRLVQLAEDNYVQHKYAFDQIQSRVKAGVGRGVDLEQAGARLALAESNLVTERANLNDVSERYRRVVGEAPPAGAPSVAMLPRKVPDSTQQAIERAAMDSPAIAAAVESYRAARAQASGRRSAYQPRVEARVRAGGGNNFDGVADQRREVTGQILLNWNLFNGGSDQARERQAVNLLGAAEAQRDKACRDVRQTVAIAHHDTLKLGTQLTYLDRNVTAIEKARDAYRQQFDIGQRSLLDLLNAENELYTARRAYAMAEYDLAVAQARTFASMGQLLPALGLTRPEPEEASGWKAGDDDAARCPLAPTELSAVPQAELDARARAMAVAAPAQPAPVTAPAAPAAEDQAANRVKAWAAAWTAKDIDRYIGFYSPSFQASRGDSNAWLANRRRLVGKPGPIEVVVSLIETKAVSPTRIETRFKQDYSSSNYKDSTVKTLVWERSGNDWLIVSESNR